MDAETGVRSPRARLSRSHSGSHPSTKEVRDADVGALAFNKER